MTKTARRIQSITIRIWYLSRKWSKSLYLALFFVKKTLDTRRVPAIMMPLISHRAAIMYPDRPVNMVD